MNKKELYERLAMPEEVVEKLLKYDGQESKVTETMKKKQHFRSS